MDPCTHEAKKLSHIYIYIVMHESQGLSVLYLCVCSLFTLRHGLKDGLLLMHVYSLDGKKNTL